MKTPGRDEPRPGACPRSDGPSDLLELAFHRLVAGATGRSPGRLAFRLTLGRAIRAVWPGFGRRRLVGGRRHAVERLGESRRPSGDRRDVGTLQRFAERRDLVLDRGLVFGRDLVAEVADRPLGLVGELLRLVAGLDLLAPLTVLVGVLGRLADHLVDVVLAEHRRRGDPDLLLLARRPVLGLDVEDA